MEYQVPQFIEVEDKIVGPLTLKQFIYVAGSVGLCVVFFVYLPLIFAIILSVPVAAFGVALSFYKMNGKPFIEILEAGFNYYTGAKLFLWKHEEPKAGHSPAKEEIVEQQTPPQTTRLTRGKLSNLAWSLDVNKQPNPNDVER